MYPDITIGMENGKNCHGEVWSLPLDVHLVNGFGDACPGCTAPGSILGPEVCRVSPRNLAKVRGGL